VELLWSCCGVVVELLWSCCGVVVELCVIEGDGCACCWLMETVAGEWKRNRRHGWGKYYFAHVLCVLLLF